MFITNAIRVQDASRLEHDEGDVINIPDAVADDIELFIVAPSEVPHKRAKTDNRLVWKYAIACILHEFHS